MEKYFLAVDIGASSGRHILSHLEDGKIVLEEVFRFENGMQEIDGHKCWDSDLLFSNIKEGMKKCAELGKVPAYMGIDTWGVDYVLVDKAGKGSGMPSDTGMTELPRLTEKSIRLFRRKTSMPGPASQNRYSTLSISLPL